MYRSADLGHMKCREVSIVVKVILQLGLFLVFLVFLVLFVFFRVFNLIFFNFLSVF